MRPVQKLAATAAIAGFLGVTAAVAHATEYDLTYSNSGAGISANLLLQVDNAGDITIISGTRNGVSVAGPSSYDGADNMFSAIAPYLTDAGLSFDIGGPTPDSFNLYYNDIGGYNELDANSNGLGQNGEGTPVTLAVVETPEPASLAVLGASLLGLGFVVRRRA